MVELHIRLFTAATCASRLNTCAIIAIAIAIAMQLLGTREGMGAPSGGALTKRVMAQRRARARPRRVSMT